MAERLNLLIVDNDIGFVHAAAQIARQHGYEITVAGNLLQAQARLNSHLFDLVLVNQALPDGNATALLDQLDRSKRTQALVIIPDSANELALKMMHPCVVECFTKPVHADRFSEALKSAAQHRHKAIPALESEPWHGLAGRSPATAEICQQILRVAPTGASIFIEGESGVGKELVASAIHAESGRSGEFVAINCGAVPPDLLSSQLFGHERGSFTGANTRHVGLFEQAQGGTLFLDEITEMPVHLQVHLLRALETRSIRRVGGTEDIHVDVRVVSATNRSHKDAIRDAKLREDLYYRLAEFPMSVPSLRERREDIVVLAQLFLKRLNEQYGTHRSLTREAAASLEAYGWPGNVRELKNVIQRAYILAEGDLIAPVLPNRDSRPVAETPTTITFAVGTSIHEIERRMLYKTLAFFDNNKAKAAQALGITTKTIYNRLTSYRQATNDEFANPEEAGKKSVAA